MGTKEGAAKARRKAIEKFGSVEAWTAAMRENGSKGGKVKNPNKGFGYRKQKSNA